MTDSNVIQLPGMGRPEAPMHVIVASDDPVEAIATVRVIFLLAAFGGHGLTRAPLIEVRSLTGYGVVKRTGIKRSTKPMRRTPLAARSAKKAETDRVYEAARAERMLQAGGWCEGATPACPLDRHPGVLAHHVRRRKGQPDQHAVEHLRWLCDPGHRWVHDHPTEAKARGLLVSSDA